MWCGDTSRNCSFAMGWFGCFAGGERRIIASAGRLVGAGIDPAGSAMASHPACVRLVSVISGHSVIVSVFVMASCGVVLEVRRHPSARQSACLSSAALRAHFLVWWMTGGHNLHWTSSVKDSLCNRFEGSLRCKLRGVALVSGLLELAGSAAR